MTLSGLMAAFAFSFMQQAGPPPPPPPDAPAVMGFMHVVFANFGVLVVVQLVVAVLGLAAGVALLYRKAWARTALEVLSWLGFLYCVGFGIFWLYMWITMTGQIPEGQGQPDMASFRWMGAIMGIVITLVFAVPFAIMIRYLRGREARAAVS
jgi:hypothetical protein